MRITIPDALADAYQVYATAAGCSLDEIITRQLRKTASVSPHAREVILGVHALEALEERLGGGPLVSGDDLVKRFQRLASISFEGIDLKLSVGQLEELARRAKKQGKTPEQLIAVIASVLARDFFDVPDSMVTQPRVAPAPKASTIPGLANAPA